MTWLHIPEDLNTQPLCNKSLISALMLWVLHCLLFETFCQFPAKCIDSFHSTFLCTSWCTLQ